MDNPHSPLNKVFRHGNLVIDSYAGRVTKGTKEVTLTAKEYLVLLLFARNVGKVISVDDLIESFWGHPSSFNNHVVYITLSRLRKKIEDESKNPVHILTIKGIGYVMPKEPTA